MKPISEHIRNGTFVSISFAPVRLRANCVHVLKSVICAHNSGSMSLMYHRHPSLASITILGWNTTQCGESDKF